MAQPGLNRPKDYRNAFIRAAKTPVVPMAIGAGLGYGAGYGAQYLLNQAYPDSWLPSAVLPVMGLVGGGAAGYALGKNLDKLQCLVVIGDLAKKISQMQTLPGR